MTSSAAEEKRADERRIKELREFQRANPTNRRCFDCNEMMPQYVCLDFNTFVCTTCSGIHREFAHRVKGISMSKFTDTEVKNMLSFGGNEAAQKYWRARHDPSFRPSGTTEGERTRNFIRLTYIDRKWVFESPKASKADDQPQRTNSSSSKKSSFESKPAARTASGKSATASTSFDAFAGNSQQDDFAAFGSSSSSGFDAFGDFSTAPKPAAAPPLRDEFKSGSFKLAPPPGSHFAASTTTATTSTPTSSTAADIFGLSSPAAATASDPFGFNDACTSARTSSKPSNPSPSNVTFDPFGSSSSNAANFSASFDAFAPASTSSHRSASSSFESKTATTAAVSSPSSGFEPFEFGTPAPAEANLLSPLSSGTPNNSFAQFGSSDPFAAFPSTTSSAAPPPVPVKVVAPADPFAAFTSATPSAAPEPLKSAPADPFAAFEDIPAPTTSATLPGASADPFGAPNASPSAGFPASMMSPSPTMTSPSPNDPFGFGQAPVPQPPPSPVHRSFGFNAPTNMMSPPTQSQGGFANPFPSPQQQMPTGMPGYANAQMQGQPQQYSYPGGQAQPWQMQQNASMPVTQQSSTPVAPTSMNSGSRQGSGPLPQAQKPAANVAAMNDPFASLSLGSFGLASTPSTTQPSSTSSSRTNSRGMPMPCAMNPPPSSGGMGMSLPSVATSGMNMGTSMGMATPTMKSAPGSSRGSSFDNVTMNAAARTGSSSSAHSFTSAAMPASMMAPSQSATSSFGTATASFGNTTASFSTMPTQQTGSFSHMSATPSTTTPAAPTTFAAFGDFTSASAPPPFQVPPSQPAVSSVNPFDMF